MKSLVTGATGLLGSSLVRELLRNNTEVRVMVREKSDTRTIDGLDLERVKGDIRNGESMKEALKGCNIFYQNAGLYVDHAPAKEYFDINVEGTKTALNAALEQGVEKVVYTSSVAAVGYAGQPGKLADEKTQFNWGNSGMPYYISKYQGEQSALEFCKKGLPLVVVNPTGMIGDRDIKPTPTGQIILNFLNGKLPGYFGGGFNFVDADDVARGIILAAQKGRIGERYILGGTNLSYKEMFDMVAEIAGIKPINQKFSRNTLIAMAYLMKFISFFTRKPPEMDPLEMRILADRDHFYDCSKATKELGYQSTPIKTAFEKAINWFQKNGYVIAKS